MNHCRKCIVKGRVQGVFFRASACVEARRLNLTGYAKNLPAGEVEVLACGTTESLDELQRWLWQGPPAAKVTEVVCTEVTTNIPRGFVTA
jgi:acylphosphatase